MIAPDCLRVAPSQQSYPGHLIGRIGQSYEDFQGQKSGHCRHVVPKWGNGRKNCNKSSTVSQNISRFGNEAADLAALFKSSFSITDKDERLLSCDSGIAVSERSYFDYDDESNVESNGNNSVPEFSNVSLDNSQGDIPIDSTLLPWELPGIAQQLAIIHQAEYYFSDDYLSRDAYFLRQIRRKKEGYLSMKLITNFKKIRKLVKDPRITAYCLRKSKALRVNDAGTKVKRILEVPCDLRRFQPQNSVLVIGIPERLAKIEAVMNVFYKCGDMSSVRLIRPGKDCPGEILEHLEKRNDRTLWTKVNAVIEYERSESAMAACRFLTNSRKSHGIEKVCLLAYESNSKPHQPKQRRNWRTDHNPAQNRIAKAGTGREWKSDAVSNMSSEFIEKEENKSDNAWIQDVVNHVLHQSSKTLSDHGIGSSCSESDSENKLRKGEYSKLHSDLKSDTQDPSNESNSRHAYGIRS
uniref:la-related protein 6-like n=1 Tax=Styela clava TaxID=7725 RepID=UPI0019395350|nr:la-related protein 6-like [Styela clava]